MSIMQIGKIPNSVLQELILNKIRNIRKEVLIKPRVGEDCCAVDFGDYACVLSSDPITGAVNEVGRLAVHVSCNDIASSGVEPIGLLATILAPPGTTEEDIDIIMEQLCETAHSINVDIVGGHTEITSSVNRVVIVATAIGRALKDKLITSSGAMAGDDIVLTKYAGLEGTAIIAHDKEDELLKCLDREVIERAKKFIEYISVVKEGVIAGKFGATSMHDATEGGVLGAIWEISEASGKGVWVDKGKIPITDETKKIAEFYGINPLKLISSGCLLITCEDGHALADQLAGFGIKATVIGKVTKDKKKILQTGTYTEEILQPVSDELYKVIK